MSDPMRSKARRGWRFAAGAATLALLFTGGALATGRHAPAPVLAAEAIAVPAPAAAAPRPAASGYADLVARVAPSIVTVRAERLAKPVDLSGDFGFGPRDLQPRREGGLGSGVIVGADGTLLTNNHVVEGAARVRVELHDRRVLEAKVLGTDPASDLAVLKVEAKDLPAALPFGDSDGVRVGEVVLAFGNPLGVGQTVSMGIVSAKGRATGPGDGSFEDFIQTDAAINRGNSGGALVNTSGQLVGINSQILTPTGGNIGIGFAIPARMAESVMGQLVSDGSVRRGQLGVTVQGITSDLARSLGLRDVSGALVSGVVKGSPADRGGLRRGDVIRSVDGQAVTDGNALRNRIAATKPGTTVALGLLREGREETVRVPLGELAAPRARAEAGEAGESGRLGLQVRPVTPEMARELGLESSRGLYVAGVDPSGPAAAAGIEPGDVIEQVNREPVTDAPGLRAAVRASGEKPALVLVTRRGGSLFITLEAPKA